MGNEEWRDIPGYEEYYKASSLGRIQRTGRIIERKSTGNMLVKTKILTSSIFWNYPVVALHLNGSRKAFSVHRIIANIFILNSENKPQVNHINGIKTDNRVENLEWVSSKENSMHSSKTGLTKRGSNRAHSKLTESQVLEIRSIKGMYQHEIADMFGVCQTVISKILLRKKWKHI